MTKKRIATLATCLTLVGAVAVGGTLALLTSGPRELTNTFTVGNGYDDTETNPDFALKENIVVQNPNTGDYEITTADDKWLYSYETLEGETQQGVQSYDNIVANSDVLKNPTFELRNASTSDEQTPPPSWIVAKVDNVDDLAKVGLKISAVDAENNWRLVTVEDGTVTLSADTALTVDQIKDSTAETKYYYIFKDQLTYNGDVKETDPLFTQLQADDTVDAKKGVSTSLNIQGVAVQAMEGSSLYIDGEPNNVLVKEIFDSLPDNF